MTNLDQRYGPVTGRVWGLVVNFCSNALALYGAVRFVGDGSHLSLLVLGGVATLCCVLLLARPSS
jgi:hypothetical protein